MRAKVLSLGVATLLTCFRSQCNALAESGLGDVLSYPGQSLYEQSVGSYFSVFEQVITPYCVVQPSSASEVSTIIKTFVAANSSGHECLFAVRSGGHTPFAGAANIDDGITVDLSALNSVTYQADANTTAVGPGATWDQVYLAVESQGHQVVGGRSSTVGVGGLSIGGGNSYYASRMGLVCDNVLQFEVVLASGEVVSASLDENPDLFKALKGGSSNTGIVTRLDLTTFPLESLWEESSCTQTAQPRSSLTPLSSLGRISTATPMRRSLSSMPIWVPQIRMHL